VSLPVYDAVLAGGGLSGLSLAARLAASRWRDRAILIVDDPTAAHADSWGFWSAEPDLLDAGSATYRQIRVFASGRSAVLPLDPYRYRVVRRPDLRRAVTDMAAGCPKLEFRTGRVESVRDFADRAEVVVGGERLSAAWVFDSVTPAPRPGPPDGRLAFTGWAVRCERPVFDPATPTLFDFRAGQPGHARFGYVLPEDDRRAFVELTEFVPRRAVPPGAGERAAALDRYLRDVLGCGSYEIGRTEAAVLPLRTRPARRCGRHVLAVGARGGLVRASTGYGYQRIQHDSRAVVASLERHGHPFDLPGGRRRYQMLDAVLLALLDREPDQLERAFASLFFDCPVRTVLRFLDEESSPAQEFRLIAALAPAPFLRAAARCLTGRRRVDSPLHG
jgi:lycopene beta-cyclase